MLNVKGGCSMLTRPQEEAVTMYIEGNTISDIARSLKVTRNTIYNWLDKSEVKAELDRRKQCIATQGNQYILKDLRTYIDKIKELAKDKSDKRVCLTANRYLIDRVLGLPTATGDEDMDSNSDSVNENELEEQLKRFKNMKVVK